MKLWPLLSLGVAITIFAACDDDKDDSSLPTGSSGGLLGDSGTADGSAPAADANAVDAGADTGGQSVGEECGPGATRCCTRYSDGTKGCSPPPTILNTCIAGECADVSPKPVGLVVETCGPNGTWVDPGENCSTNCTPGSVRTTVGCGYCGATGAARCLDVSCTCE